MRIAQRNTNAPMFGHDLVKTLEYLTWDNEPGYALIEVYPSCNNGIAGYKNGEFLTGYIGPDRFVTLCYLKVTSDKWLVASSIHNPLDRLDRQVGREVAFDRLTQYLQHGITKRHKEGRNADHFLVEVDDSEVTKGWRVRVAEFILEHSCVSKL